jgi:3-phosphoglycerate kinase
MNAQTIADLEIAGKRVLIRADLNVPLDKGVIPHQRSSEQVLPNGSRISRPVAVHRWSFSRARNYRASRA